MPSKCCRDRPGGSRHRASGNGPLAILREKHEVLERSARSLLEKETLNEKDLANLIGKPADPRSRIAAE